MPPSAPRLPIAADFTVGTLTLVVTFDGPLIPGLTAVPNWFVRQGGATKVVIAPGVVAGSTVTVQTALGGFNPGPDVCSYFAAPPDLVGTNGVPIAPFISFPLNVHP